ncbi:MAG: DUF4340 domain-containing protein [Planctomycetota bacterium]|nr:DUF4340 domain-containing protein [Planctomycetota bacterium]
MTEGTKTGSLAAVVGIVVLLAWATSNSTRVNTPVIQGMIGKPLFEKFTDPTTAASLKILRYDTPTENYVDFEVARDRKVGLWTIPSHESYPADAGKQMSDAANLFVGLKVVGIATQKKAEQALFGVVEPNKQNADKGGEGVGMLVQLRDEKGNMLADLIIGKEDKNKRYVRVPSEDVVYVVDLETTSLSTDFKKWIEPDLLKLSSNDIETLGVRDYQIVQVQQGLALDRKYEADLTFATSNGQWQASRITSFESDPPTERPLTPDEQLNATKLNEIKNTLDNLKIADVVKKPAGLAADLRADSNLLKNTESLSSLQRRGFFPNPNQKGDEGIEFYAKSGELIVTLKDGVQYLLRFGASAGAEINAVEPEAGKEGEKAKEEFSINRFMLVTARVDESKFPMPELERLPETVEELKEMERMKQKPADMPAVVPAPQATSVEPAVPATTEAKPGEEKGTDKTTEETTAEGDKPTAEKPAEPATPAAEAPAPEKPASLSLQLGVPTGRFVGFQEPQEEAKKPDAPAKADAAVKSDAPAVAQEPTEEEWKERLEATRDRITKENKRKLDLRDEKLKVAKNKVAELNGRFADWYYVVSEADYKKLRIVLPELVQPKSASGPGAGAGAPQGGFPGGGAFPGFQP